MASPYRMYCCSECDELYETYTAADRCCPEPEDIPEAMADEAGCATYCDYMAKLENAGQRVLHFS